MILYQDHLFIKLGSENDEVPRPVLPPDHAIEDLEEYVLDKAYSVKLALEDRDGTKYLNISRSRAQFTTTAGKTPYTLRVKECISLSFHSLRSLEEEKTTTPKYGIMTVMH